MPTCVGEVGFVPRNQLGVEMRRTVEIVWVVALIGAGCSVVGGSGESVPTTLAAAATIVAPSSTSRSEGETGTVHVEVAFGVADSRSCADVEMHDRTVDEATNPIEAAVAALLTGPAPSEVDQGASSWFSGESAGLLRSVVLVDGLLTVDFDPSLPSVMNNASTSCGSEQMLGELNATAFQFQDVARVTYELQGSCEDFFGWLQRECQQFERP